VVEAKIGVIGGSGLYQIDGVSDLAETKIETPFGRTERSDRDRHSSRRAHGLPAQAWQGPPHQPQRVAGQGQHLPL